MRKEGPGGHGSEKAELNLFRVRGRRRPRPRPPFALTPAARDYGVLGLRIGARRHRQDRRVQPDPLGHGRGQRGRMRILAAVLQERDHRGGRGQLLGSSRRRSFRLPASPGARAGREHEADRQAAADPPHADPNANGKADFAEADQALARRRHLPHVRAAGGEAQLRLGGKVGLRQGDLARRGANEHVRVDRLHVQRRAGPATRR